MTIISQVNRLSVISDEFTMGTADLPTVQQSVPVCLVGPVCLVRLAYLVALVCLVCLVWHASPFTPHASHLFWSVWFIWFVSFVWLAWFLRSVGSIWSIWFVWSLWLNKIHAWDAPVRCRRQSLRRIGSVDDPRSIGQAMGCVGADNMHCPCKSCNPFYSQGLRARSFKSHISGSKFVWEKNGGACSNRPRSIG